ncbi:FBP domain-containing protein [Agrococcus sp. ARC_14]|uniref:FBP domain-containing protein n=1 Tax=Agrococcus sp. ARC_14 TaxID=2919927 RepID=UPI001F06D36E|nr:FBP domain-containing protein [Agrococcus sp. ARC_14]MCH1882015.1 FBP domain-containing protein [Agrococcus sp. ARC_14]
MLPITEQQIRGAFVNASRKETSLITVPDGLDATDWESLDFLGWRDQRLPRRAYAVIPTLDGDPVGILFQQAEAAPRSRAQCTWCQDVRLPNDVVFMSAKLAGPAGRKGDTVGTLVCERFQCSQNVRKLPPLAYEGYDLEAARVRRIDELQLRAASFVDAVTRA